MLVVERDIPLWLKRESPVVDLTKGKESGSIILKR
jgi:hypothetical protein